MPSSKKVGDIFGNDTIIGVPYIVFTALGNRYYKAETQCNICDFITKKPINVYRGCSMCKQYGRKILYEGGICKLELTGGEYTIIDVDDIQRVRNHTWYLSKRGSVEARINKKLIKIHRFILGYSGNLVIDHIDRNPLNNSKKNLRICTQMNNCHNSSAKNTNKTGVKGVWKTKNGRYITQICIKGVKEHIGTYTTIEEATNAYKEKSLEYHGDFSIMKTGIE